jgi:hypothetical protein
LTVDPTATSGSVLVSVLTEASTGGSFRSPAAAASARAGIASTVAPAATPDLVSVEESTGGSFLSSAPAAAAGVGAGSTDDRKALLGCGKDGYESSESAEFRRSGSAIVSSDLAAPVESVGESGRDGTSKGVGTRGGTNRSRFVTPDESSRESTVSSREASTVRTSLSARVLLDATGARERDEIRMVSAAGASCRELSVAFPFHNRLRFGKWRAIQSDLWSGHTSPGAVGLPADRAVGLAWATWAPGSAAVDSALGPGHHENRGRADVSSAAVPSAEGADQFSRREALAQPENPSTLNTSKPTSGVRLTAFPPASTSFIAHPWRPNHSRIGSLSTSIGMASTFVRPIRP